MVQQQFQKEDPATRESEIQSDRPLTLDSVLGDLPSFQVKISPNTPGREVTRVFEKDPDLPGVLVLEKGVFHGVISRQTFFERTGKLFGTEVFLGRPIKHILETIPHQALTLPETMLIILASQKALAREPASIYEPLVLESSRHQYRLLSAMILFMAQSQQLLDVHRQRLFTVDAGMEITQRQAILRFIKHVGNQPEFNVSMFTAQRAVRCDNCSKMVNYSMVDIVRTFPQLNRGVIVEEKMGSRIYRVYVRHLCAKGEIWEIPLHLDEQLEYRSQRPARAVENYA